MNEPVWCIFDNTAELDQTLADAIAEQLTEALSQRARATLVVSGGTTPIKMFGLLSRKALPWNRVTIVLADERWVSVDHADSNERLVREHLLINAAASALFLGMKTDHSNPVDAETFINQRLSELGTLDVAVLGMGTDGHTASLFPQAPSLDEGLACPSDRQCIAIFPAHAPHARMSMTLARLLNSRVILLHITGQQKLALLQQIHATTDPRKLPIAAIINQNHTPVRLYLS